MLTVQRATVACLHGKQRLTLLCLVPVAVEQRQMRHSFKVCGLRVRFLSEDSASWNKGCCLGRQSCSTGYFHIKAIITHTHTHTMLWGQSECSVYIYWNLMRSLMMSRLSSSLVESSFLVSEHCTLWILCRIWSITTVGAFGLVEDVGFIP